MQVNMTVNGEQVTADVEPRMLLVHFLRDQLRLTGTHWGCDTSNCGTCVVDVDGVPVKSCTMLAVMASGHSVRTVEGLAVNGQLDPVQEGFMRCHGLHVVGQRRHPGQTLLGQVGAGNHRFDFGMCKRSEERRVGKECLE